MSNKFFYILIATILISAKAVTAQTNEQELLRSVLLSEEEQTQTEAKKAQEDAGKLLNKRPPTLDIKIKNANGSKRNIRKTTTSLTPTSKSYGDAPFGTIWGYSVQDTEILGIILKDISSRDNPRTFSASFLPKGIPDFDEYVLFYGIENKLWQIVGYGKPIEDDASGSNVLKVYDKYVRLLNIKYGNYKEHFKPKINIKEEIIPAKKNIKDSKEEIIRTETPTKIGGETFIEDLKSGETSLYSTVGNGSVGVILSVNVNENGKSYIIIDYKNLTLIKEREEQALDAI